MSDYTPDRWTVLEFSGPSIQTIRKVFAGWYGGFMGSNSWKLNSGITAIRINDKGFYEFDGYSGSTYYCHANSNGMSGYQAGVLSSWVEGFKDKNIQIKEIDLEDIVPL